MCLARLYVILLLIQKIHSVHGSISEAIARGAKDWLEDVRGLRGFFDVCGQLTTKTHSHLNVSLFSLSNKKNTGLSHLYVLLIG